ncbi:disulfide bond formation protein B [Cognatishimia sp. SS12]|uniref:disulfide bond formation protein B n=1 Tax=Cognatishimia sp. SS12 TaxID=2979465 RepID=UPI00232C2E3D|nr:disulfide bond formation protein B [Cognatishimia sp. SS12]MDC0737040.1 disulfide bond formation protein B [Cognatishimia sp. SS12]
MTQRALILSLTAASAALLIGAWGFQYFGYAPCKLCYWQRYPHMAAVLIGAIAYAAGLRVLAWLGAAATATTGVIGIYHSGVERKLWEGPNSCTSTDIGGLNSDELFEQIMTAPLIRCDEIPWQMAGLTMANLNAVFSLVLAVLWVIAARKTA